MDRRTFLATGVAAGAVGFGSRSVWPGFAAAEAAAVDGVPKGLVSQTFAPLVSSLVEYGRWNPYPKVGDAKWGAVPQPAPETIVARGHLPHHLSWDWLHWDRRDTVSSAGVCELSQRQCDWEGSSNSSSVKSVS